MKVQIIEQAIDGQMTGIFKDEVVMSKGQVVAFYGHGKHNFVKWDEFGRGFTCQSEKELPMSPMDPRNEVENWERNIDYDLKF